MDIGFIGLGRMGFALARSLLKHQQRVTVFDINTGAAQQLGTEGAVVAPDVASLCRSVDIVFTMLPGPKQVKQVALGENGILQNLQPGAIYIDMSTIDVDTVDLLNDAFTQAGFVFGDAPVGRLAMHADRGESLFMLGIDAQHLPTVEPVLYQMGTTIHHCGHAGSGTRTKIINNMMVLCYCQINSEALVLARSLGLDTAKTFDVLVNTTASNGQLKEKWPKKVLAGDLSPGFDLALGYKDISLASSAGASTQVALPVCDTAKNVFRMALAAGKAGQDTSCLTDYWAEVNGVEKIRL
ncbi:NAD(P)-dependent oxidoreductase [Comamonas terrigena]|uniref:NAD(P)-dependent oxidoreductase n=1 Tax=Comamonas terrigena TaxID=32013 RepID=A0A2A7UZ24_COMTR|nr:NAD(P)-dependent oxidoreductase [Comamonas terrigena]PEH90484.1 NAD(P)-dependent oxidoreductase [Comamonas terrigena]BBL25858.1 3-sulfolactaldehyde reductase [Comamonas terrigena NBRC 13299]SUY70579.1 2-(hydroxymethyl)glutarate dehydrogenase [Comamonas terrigena]